MGLSKATLFAREQNEIATIGRVLAHPARVAILKILLEKQVCICGEIVEDMPLSQSTISQHLKELKKAGLVKGHNEGVRTSYSLNTDKWRHAKDLLGALFGGEVQSIKSHKKAPRQ